jgi:putative nucleotidyltransferase with HDIG domain
LTPAAVCASFSRVSNTAAEAHEAAERFRLRLAERDVTDGAVAVHVTASFGTSAVDRSGVLTVDALIRQADEALYTAKQSGRNCSRAWTDMAVADEGSIRTSDEQVQIVRRQVASLSTQVHDALLETMMGLVHAIEARDRYAGSHSENVTAYAVGIAESLGLSAAKVDVVRGAAVVHDTGKIGIPADLLRKSGVLTVTERQVIQQHPLIGVQILNEMQYLEHEIPIVRHHHEHWDGQGYPDGLSGRAIPLGARILAVADAFDAITSERPYRTSHTVAEALEIVRSEAGRQFDPIAVDALLAWTASVARHFAVEVAALTPADLLVVMDRDTGVAAASGADCAPGNPGG